MVSQPVSEHTSATILVIALTYSMTPSEWAILVPSWIMVSVVYIYIAYFALNLYHTRALDSLTTLVDTQAHLLPRKRDVHGRSRAMPAYDINANLGFEEDYIPPLYDLPAGMINRALFDGAEE